MAALGIDIRLHRAQRLTAELLQGVDLVLTMTSSHKADCVSAGAAQTKVMTIGVFAGTNDEVLDPFGKGFEQYEACAAQLDRLAERVADRLDRDCVAGAPIS
jgi:protein-tyrosine-phosphatase